MQFPLTACPGLFYNTLAKDGFLCRLRIPGGMINSQQFEAIADISDHYGGGYIDITNRANIQIREIKQEINIQVLEKLQALGLASTNASVDHIRNIMTSPTAGIDTQELIDTRPLVKAWEKYITAHSHLSQLSAKFSVCFDGGGKISVKDRPNDIILAAEIINGNIHWRLYLSYGEKGEPAKDTGILLKPLETIAVLAALAETYLKHIDINNRCKPRLREIINHITIEKYLHQVKEKLDPNIFNLEKTSLCASAFLREENLIGIHSQKQSGLYYIGIVLPLGRLETYQIRGLANLAKRYGDDNIRLTPWQNLILSDIPQNQIIEVEKEITNLDLNYSPTDIKSFLVACSGKRGCGAAATETKDDALHLAKYLENLMILDCSVNIHFSGCGKSCAQHTQADITLLGVAGENFPGYQIYVLGHLLYEYVTLAKVPILVQQILEVYQQQRLSLQESFRQFIDRQKHQLKQLISKSSSNSIVTILKYHV
ncbi:precorrin-3B synthase [Dolichospermum planctonicum CS-1226]|uniref:Precorrin-3B synthase n=1 Tax=Dolichospermum planctonicum CS-1226 TaxID=3021751 RepID=A0ABT5AKQ8_9CYAN|nr:precorrin-3B synthase [Dolichospermum planctonicum]MDB9537901.1 precorrin-3B synthase [Dolichospermum planctonicum CS-1226]